SYIVRRATFLNAQASLLSIGRRRSGVRVTAKEAGFSSKQLGSRDSFQIKGVEGVHMLDCFVSVLVDQKKRRSYRLDDVAPEVLARRDAYTITLVESRLLGDVVSVQLLGLDSKPCTLVVDYDSEAARQSLIDVGTVVVDRGVYPIATATRPLRAGTYLIA